MTLKLFIFLTTYVLLVYGNDVEQKDNSESYITKEAAKELRSKLRARDDQREKDYDDILTRIIMSVQQSHEDNYNQALFEKKYFDYLPNELDSEDISDDDSPYELVKSVDTVMSEESDKNARRVNSRKFKRDVTSGGKSQDRVKRQSIYYVPVPLIHYSPYPNIDYFYPQTIPDYPAASSIQNRFIPDNVLKRNANLNPWHPQANTGKFHTPYNFYLPSKPGNNNPNPPHNPSVNPNEIIDRVAGFEEDDTSDRIWSTFPSYSGGGSGFNSIQNYNPWQPQPPRRPPVTTKRPYVDQNSIEGNVNPEENVELEIELPPEIFDNGPATTRAPLKIPKINKTHNPNRNRGQNRKPEVPISSEAQTPSNSNGRSANNQSQTQTIPVCVLAIVNCCSRYDDIVRIPCFEKHNCNGSFLGKNSCSPTLQSAALREVEKYSR
ncbi:CLUMA_CG000833, isoform A [Clunio marinus]|uniref:CLUMA_CG000833, isoform A n=1 Tax=Clunio marinus TaxID=568069 RepID=A0A1J1HKM3_9DIPT|nr:CLUMA_CG000833, isoform A [Clunio marinus]